MLASWYRPTTLRWWTTLCRRRLWAVMIRMPGEALLEVGQGVGDAVPHDAEGAVRRPRNQMVSDQHRRHDQQDGDGGRSGLSTNSAPAIATSVRPCTARLTRPSWNSAVRLSMSDVMRVMSRPAFSPVKKSSDSRWKWLKTRTRQRLHQLLAEPAGEADPPPEAKAPSTTVAT